MKDKKYSVQEWYEIAKPILTNPEFQRRKTYLHHGTITVYDHVLEVSFCLYRWTRSLGLDYKSATIAGLLHDFYKEPWMEDVTKRPLFKRHGFTHAADALDNSRIHFKEYMNPLVENSILRHMFPLNITPPKYLEGWLLTLADKKVSMEVFFEPMFYKALIRGILGR